MPSARHKRKAARLGAARVGRSPHRALAVAVYTARYRGALIRAARLSREASRAAAAARRPGVRKEARSASVSLGQAVARARRIGIASAITDEKIAVLLNRTLDHAANSVAELTHEKPKHRARRFVLMIGLVLAIVSGLWMVTSGRRTRPRHRSNTHGITGE